MQDWSRCVRFHSYRFWRMFFRNSNGIQWESALMEYPCNTRFTNVIKKVLILSRSRKHVTTVVDRGVKQ